MFFCGLPDLHLLYNGGYILVLRLSPLASASLPSSAGGFISVSLKDIDWKGHRIRIITGKTGQEVELPLLENTGWAIIDYLQNGGPKTDCGCVFVRHQAPYGPIGSTATLDTALGRYIMKAGITIKKGEHRGMHTLRNSLAKNMLDAGAAIPVISQTLGHADINTTAIYLKIDIEGLRQCALDPDERGVC